MYHEVPLEYLGFPSEHNDCGFKGGNMAAALRSGLLGNHVLIARKCYRIVFQSAAFLATETGDIM